MKSSTEMKPRPAGSSAWNAYLAYRLMETSTYNEKYWIQNKRLFLFDREISWEIIDW